MKTLQEKIAELPLDTQKAVQKRFKKLKQMFLESKIYYPNTTDLVEELDYLESENNI
jgi:hypothetical protein